MIMLKLLLIGYLGLQLIIALWIIYRTIVYCHNQEGKDNVRG